MGSLLAVADDGMQGAWACLEVFRCAFSRPVALGIETAWRGTVSAPRVSPQATASAAGRLRDIAPLVLGLLFAVGSHGSSWSRYGQVPHRRTHHLGRSTRVRRLSN